jgi:pimeloyl-ACP methyl ester carboxylesterase
MVVLFVHGMGRSPLSAWPLLHKLRQSGLKTEAFAYVAAIEDFDSIAGRLKTRIETLAQRGPYLVVGHSLGGVLLRAAVNALRHETPLPTHLYLLGSPILPSRIAVKLKSNLIFRLVTGDSGQLLSSHERMKGIGAAAVPTTCIVVRAASITRSARLAKRSMMGWCPFQRSVPAGVRPKFACRSCTRCFHPAPWWRTSSCKDYGGMRARRCGESRDSGEQDFRNRVKRAAKQLTCPFRITFAKLRA